MVSVLDGLDLSEKMIALAAAKKIYRNLHTGNMMSFLKTTRKRYDFFLAADVFAYVGDLAETFALLRKCARQDALFCFSTETLAGQSYRLQQTGRFAHSPDYIEDVALTTGWKITASLKTSLRKEKGNWVAGDLWFLQLIDNA
jgi:predicted TPR repeat methyltransferase